MAENNMKKAKMQIEKRFVMNSNGKIGYAYAYSNRKEQKKFENVLRKSLRKRWVKKWQKK